MLKRCRNILKDQKGVANMVDNHIYPNINENMKGVEWKYCQLILSFNQVSGPKKYGTTSTGHLDYIC